MYDGHRSHETIELREAADKAKIHLFCIPPHTSHRLQPLDVGVFGPLQRAWQKRCSAFLDATGQSIARQDVVKEYLAARTESITEELIISAWRQSGIRPLNPQVFTDEDFAPSYASSTNPPLPVSFSDLDNGPEASSSGQQAATERNDSNEGPGAESNTMMDASGLNVAHGGSRGSLSTMLPDPEITAYSVQPTPLTEPTTPSNPSNETCCIFREEGGSDSPNQPSAERSRMQQLFVSPLPVNSPCSTQRQTRSLSRSLSRSQSHASDSRHGSTPSTSTSSDHVKALEKRVEELEKASEEWRTHCHFMNGIVLQLQSQLQAKEKKRGTHAKRTQVEARVLTSEEGRLELQQLREEARLKEERQAEEAARKATEDDARRKRRADFSRIFTGTLNKSRLKEDLEDLAVALALPVGSKKDELLDKITKHFDEHPELKTSPRFEGLFNPRPRKRARVTDARVIDAPTAGPSNFQGPAAPALPLHTFPAPPPSPFTFGPSSTPHDFQGFDNTSSQSISTQYYDPSTFYYTQ